MNILTTIFIFNLLIFFFTHFVFFFNLNWQSRKTVNLVNLLALWFYVAYLSYCLLSIHEGLFVDRNQHLLVLGGVLLLIFVITDFFSGTKSLGLIFSILILLLGIMGVISIHYQEPIYVLTKTDNIQTRNFLLLLDQLAVLFFFIAFLLSILYHYSFIEVKYHRRFFFSNRFPGFNRLWHLINRYLIVGCLFMAVSLFFTLGVEKEAVISRLHNKVVGGIIIIYYLTLLYIRYQKYFSSKLNLYWMLLSIILLVVKVGYW